MLLSGEMFTEELITGKHAVYILIFSEHLQCLIV
jgi:hypothetical protein